MLDQSSGGRPSAVGLRVAENLPENTIHNTQSIRDLTCLKSLTEDRVVVGCLCAYTYGHGNGMIDRQYSVATNAWMCLRSISPIPILATKPIIKVSRETRLKNAHKTHEKAPIVAGSSSLNSSIVAMDMSASRVGCVSPTWSITLCTCCLWSHAIRQRCPWKSSCGWAGKGPAGL